MTSAPARQAPLQSRRGKAKRALRGPVGYLFVAPALLIFLVFTIGPAFYTFFISLFNWKPLNPARSRYVGLGNYTDLFTSSDPPFGQSVLTSLYFTAAMVIGGTLLSLGIALLLQRGGRWMSTSRIMIFAPHVTPLVATSIAWVWIFNGQFGFANVVLGWLGIDPINWLQSSTWALPAVVIYSLWHEIGFTVVVFLGGLATLSPDLNEAAKVDGVNWWQEFWYVTWPQLRPVTTFVIMISTIASLQAFTQFYTMTSGNNGTTTVSFLLYQEVFDRTGYGAAIAMVLLVVIVGLSLIQRKVTRPSNI
jgi:ABC-type sugar transport system permease subunit